MAYMSVPGMWTDEQVAAPSIEALELQYGLPRLVPRIDVQVERGFKGPLHGQSVVLPTLHTNESTTHHAPRGPQGVVWTSTPSSSIVAFS